MSALTEIKQLSKRMNQASHGFTVGTPVYYNGTYNAAQANASGTLGEYVVSRVIDVDNFEVGLPLQDIAVTVSGILDGASGAPSAGDPLYVSETESGKLSTVLGTTFLNAVANYKDANTITILGTAIGTTGVGSGGGGGSTTFIALTDTPGAFGTAGQILQVNATTDALEFVDNTSLVTIDTKTADYTVVTTDAFPGKLLTGDGSGATVNFTVPVTTGYRYSIQADDLTNAVTITPASGLINGQASWSFGTVYDAVQIIADGTNLRIV